MNEQITREAVAVFNTVETMQEAVDDLLSSGFNRADLSFLADERAIEEKLGHIYVRTQDLEDNPKSPSIAYISNNSIGDAEGALIGTPMYIAAVTTAGIMAVAGGPLALTIASVIAAGAAGAAIGSVFAYFVGEHHAEFLQKQLDHGGLLLWVRVRDSGHEARALEVLKKHSAHDVHVHGIPAQAKG